MIIKNNSIEINPDDIFKNDALNREDTIKSLTNLVMKISDSYVLCINGNWGIGKTTFIKLWQNYLKKKNINSIYFNSWKNDFSKEPILSILGEFNQYIDNNNFDNKDSVVNKFNKVKKISGKVIKRAVPAFVKGVTSGILDIDKGFESAIGAITEESSKELIENYSKEKEATEKFKDAIKKVLKELNSDKPFIIFIDELDRCRPLYAIELLESIKHIFGIEKLIFILSLDKKQLSQSIKSQYGNIDTDNYLRRFIDLEYQLSNPNIDRFCDALYEKFNLDKFILNKKDLPNFNDIIKSTVKVFNLSLRQIEQIFSRLNIIFNSTQINYNKIELTILFEILKSYNPNLYDDYIKDRDSQKLLDSIRLHIQLNMDIFRLFELLKKANSQTISEIIQNSNIES